MARRRQILVLFVALATIQGLLAGGRVTAAGQTRGDRTSVEGAGAPGMHPIHFDAIDIAVDSGAKPLAAYQVRFRVASGIDPRAVRIVGIEGGEHAAYREAPFHDLAAIQGDEVVIGAFSTAAANGLPRGRTRVARIHVEVHAEFLAHGPIAFETTLEAAATVGARKIIGEVFHGTH